MMTMSNQPLVEQYFADLTKAAGRLPRAQRSELLAEIRSHLDAGVSEANSDADVRNMLDALGEPEDIVEAAAPATSRQLPSGRLALGLGLAGLVLTPLLGVGIVLGLAAILFGANARRLLRAEGLPLTIATIAIAVGFVDIVLPIVMIGLLEASL